MKLGERLEVAIANAAGRGMRLDIGKPIREYEDYEPHLDPPRRRVVGADKHGKPVTIPGVFSAEGRQDRPRVATGYTHEQLAFAAAGMNETQWAALLWTLDLDTPSRAHLRARLMIVAVQIKEERAWPKTMRRADCDVTGLARAERYVQDLCTLALRQIAEPDLFGTEDARARWFGISDRHWRRLLANGYGEIFDETDKWFRSGLGYLKERLRSAPRESDKVQTKTAKSAKRRAVGA